MPDITLLKKITYVADVLQKFGTLDFHSAKLEIDYEMIEKETLMYVFKVLEIPFKCEENPLVFWTSKGAPAIQFQFNMIFDDKKYLVILYYLVFLCKEIFDGRIKVFFDSSDYHMHYEGGFATFLQENSINPINKFNKNIMLDVDNILCLNIDKMDWKQFANLVICEDRTSLEHQNDNPKSINESYQKYSGSYPQDYEGYSDDVIDDAFDGDPDMYWNID